MGGPCNGPCRQIANCVPQLPSLSPYTHSALVPPQIATSRLLGFTTHRVIWWSHAVTSTSWSYTQTHPSSLHVYIAHTPPTPASPARPVTHPTKRWALGACPIWHGRAAPFPGGSPTGHVVTSTFLSYTRTLAWMGGPIPGRVPHWPRCNIHLFELHTNSPKFSSCLHRSYTFHTGRSSLAGDASNQQMCLSHLAWMVVPSREGPALVGLAGPRLDGSVLMVYHTQRVVLGC